MLQAGCNAATHFGPYNGGRPTCERLLRWPPGGGGAPSEKSSWARRNPPPPSIDEDASARQLGLPSRCRTTTGGSHQEGISAT
eukprot:7639965-Alexandrium_andersonii.AAC.1